MEHSEEPSAALGCKDVLRSICRRGFLMPGDWIDSQLHVLQFRVWRSCVIGVM